jgi:predicted nucleic acid-binding protein
MIAADSNVLVYAHREDSPWHDTAYVRIVFLNRLEVSPLQPVRLRLILQVVF